MKALSIDIETYSGADLNKCGVYKYAESPDFQILLFGYSIDGGEVRVVDLARGEKLPAEIHAALTDEKILKWAFNANFERVCLSKYLGIDGFLSPSSWRCAMVWAAYLGFPFSLANVGKVLGLENQKLAEGKSLIKYFCTPNRDGGRNFPESVFYEWELFKNYNRRDVEVEVEIQRRLAKYPVPDFVWREYALDQEINDRGILLDLELVKNAITMDEKSREKLKRAMRELTSIENPNSVAQMKSWLAENGLETETLGKKAVNELLKTAPEPLRTVLTLRQQISKSSVKKYVAMQNAVCVDGRARGMFKFYGANRTGRFSGANIQLQNLPQNHLPDLEHARELVKRGDYKMLESLYDSVPEVLSELIRTAFIPSSGRKFIVADFAAIEARVLSWLAGEEWRLDVFANNGDIYCETAARMFHCKVEKHGANKHLRQKGKQAELACGYGGSVGALKAFGATESGMKEDELKPLVDAWREANPHIVRFWYDADEAAATCIKERTTTETHGIKFICQSGIMFIELPSGRRLSYVKPQIGKNRFGGEAITYMGVGAAKKWERIETYGAKLVENITQAISRDILCFAMRTFAGEDVVAHIHDELVIECDKNISVEEICRRMSETPEWAAGLKLRSDGFECAFYRKD